MPVDPYEQLDSIFTDIADTIRYRDGKPTYQYFKDKIMTDYSVDIGSYGEAGFNYLMANPTYTFTLQHSGNYFNIVSSAAGYDSVRNCVWGPYHQNQLYLTNNVATGANAVDRNQTWYCNTGDAVYSGITDYLPPLPPEPVEEVTTNANNLQIIVTNNTGCRMAYTVSQVLTQETYKCLMTDDIYKDFSSYTEAVLFIIDSTEGNLNSEDIGLAYSFDSPSSTTITNNSSFIISVRGFMTDSRNQWKDIVEEAFTLTPGSSKTYSGYLPDHEVTFFSNTRMVQPPTDISPLDFARRVSSSITDRSKPSLNAIFTDVANAIRYEQGFPDIDPEDIKPGHILAPNGKYYGYYYYYKLTDTRYGWINMDLKIWSDYRIAGTKTYTFQLMNPTNNAFSNLSSGYVGSYEDENYYWTQEHDYFVYDGRWNNSSPMGPNYYSESYYLVETNMPLFDTQTDEQNFLKMSLIAVPDMSTLIRNL